MSITQTRFDDEEVDAIYTSDFGAALFNIYTLQRKRDERLERLYFSQRLTVVRRMLRAMLDAEQEIADSHDSDAAS